MQRKYRKKNDSEMKFRLPHNLKTDFYNHCEQLDVPVAEVIRTIMSDFLKSNRFIENNRKDETINNRPVVNNPCLLNDSVNYEKLTSDLVSQHLSKKIDFEFYEMDLSTGQMKYFLVGYDGNKNYRTSEQFGRILDNYGLDYVSSCNSIKKEVPKVKPRLTLKDLVSNKQKKRKK